MNTASVIWDAHHRRYLVVRDVCGQRDYLRRQSGQLSFYRSRESAQRRADSLNESERQDAARKTA